jgi:uncharacterized LabA/DUF88 family protein
MKNFRTACIFVDGENLRHSLIDLFSSEFNPSDYLPKTADWQGFFNHLVAEADAELRMRTYWYVVDEIDFWPYNVPRLVREDQATLEMILRKDRYWVSKLDGVAGPRVSILDAAKTLQQREHSMRKRFDGWQQLQNGIAHRFDSIEFRRAGSIMYDLFRQRFEQEKGVDVKLATDLLKLNDIYDVGIIVSGDGDYVPAVQVVKDWGKHIVNVSFLKKNGGLLPGGARRLNQSADRAIEVPYGDMRNFMNIGTKPIAVPVGTL